MVWDCHGGQNQRWNVNGNGTITSAGSGLCLDTASGGTGNGAQSILADCNSASTQRWTLR
ncbi:RICIN domain-containing protein [Streptomyces sp. B21-102]|uniref:RICIN domain-containing protein n=1 Tax=Streptomyces sp. B21-102 TaxID=3039416 RepID=UPI002FF07781